MQKSYFCNLSRGGGKHESLTRHHFSVFHEASNDTNVTGATFVLKRSSALISLARRSSDAIFGPFMDLKSDSLIPTREGGARDQKGRD